MRSPAIVATIVILLAVFIRVGVSGSGALERGRAAILQGDETLASHHFRESISWYLPVAPWRDDSAQALWDLHKSQVARGNLKDAVQSLSMLRAGFMAGRSLIGPDQVWRAQTDQALAPLMAQWEAQAAAQEGRQVPGDLKEREAHFAQVLARDTMPSRSSGLLAVLGFGLWIASIWRATGAQGRSRLRYLGAGALGFILFLVGVATA